MLKETGKRSYGAGSQGGSGHASSSGGGRCGTEPGCSLLLAGVRTENSSEKSKFKIRLFILVMMKKFEIQSFFSSSLYLLVAFLSFLLKERKKERKKERREEEKIR